MFFKFNWIPICVTVLTIVLHAIPGNELPKPYWDLFEFDKLVHIGLFFSLVFSWLNGLHKQKLSFWLKVNAVPAVLIFSLILAPSLETAQYLIFVNRKFQVGDLIADLIGTLMGFGFFYLAYGRILKFV